MMNLSEYRNRNTRLADFLPWAALAGEGVESGSFWGPQFVSHGMPRPATPSKITRDREIAARLWKVAEVATGVEWPKQKSGRLGRR